MNSGNGSTRDVVRKHVHDGIQEYDNPLPSWWVWLFILTVVFSGIYLMQYHVLGNKGLRQELADALKSQQVASGGNGDSNAAVLSDEGAAERGREVYTVNCAPCHGAQGEGGIGPNLTDKSWIHGSLEADIAKVVAEGVPDKGMPAWKPVLGPTKVNEAASFVWLRLRHTNVAGKEPQGEAEE